MIFTYRICTSGVRLDIVLLFLKKALSLYPNIKTSVMKFQEVFALVICKQHSMKKFFILIISLIVITEGRGQKQAGNDDNITIDVRKNYPKKELILQDLFDVEYIALDSSDEFVCQGEVLDIGKKFILVRNLINDGNVFVFDRKGKGLTKFNRKGQGYEEYQSISAADVVLDEDNEEIFIFGRRGIGVYDLYGKFLRKLTIRDSVTYLAKHNFDREHFIVRYIDNRHDMTSSKSQPFSIISKKDGSVVNEIRIPLKKQIIEIVTLQLSVIFLNSRFLPVFPFNESWILTDMSSDTIYRLLPDYSMIPFISRTPSIHSMNPEIFLFPIILTDRYYLLQTLKKEYQQGLPGSFPTTKLAYDKFEKKVYEYIVYNNDYITKNEIEFWYSLRNPEIVYFKRIEAHELEEANEKGELKGKLKEVADGLDEDPNPVIMLIKRKQ